MFPVKVRNFLFPLSNWLEKKRFEYTPIYQKGHDYFYPVHIQLSDVDYTAQRLKIENKSKWKQ